MLSSKNPPILINNQFIVNCKLKAAAFNNVFAAQCNPITNNNTLPQLTYLTTARLNIMQIDDNDIHPILKTLKTGKSNGPGVISTKMLLLCGDTILPPLNIFFLISGKQQMWYPFTRRKTKDY